MSPEEAGTPGSRFSRTRHDHATETAEDYVEMIEELIGESGEARGTDLAKRLGLSQVTVSKTLRRLARDGYVVAKPYRSVFLTDMGRDLARHSRERHRIVLALLEALGVPAEVAEADAEGIEHHVSDATIAAIAAFLEKLPPS